jgi:hypothetical protein
MENIPKQVLNTFSNIYFRDSIFKDNEKFDSNANEPKPEPSYSLTLTFIAWIVFGFAVYLSFKCNNGISFWGLAGAICFSPIYIIYKLTSTPKMCGLIN